MMIFCGRRAANISLASWVNPHEEITYLKQKILDIGVPTSIDSSGSNDTPAHVHCITA